MKIKVSEASGVQLDWLVAKCEGFVKISVWPTEICVCKKHSFEDPVVWCPSTDWAQGGPIIEREGINLEFDREWVYDPANADPDDEPDNGDRWRAEYNMRGDKYVSDYGPTPLIAAMRCFVASKLGDEVEVPDELC